ncbi:unnamed protein product [Paramecium pentaurelia]|uniref:40S ribosomal protein S8 n=1 Tax=Paramecium pentaurelia TaxID=43138 RepID=A0A8S1TAC3_9CILI|nr:unnamed protein product [Paramecium pentaurelia]
MSLYYQLKKNIIEPQREIEFKNFKIRNRYLVVKQLKNRNIFQFQNMSPFSPNKVKQLPKLRLPSLPNSDSNQQCLSKSPKNIVKQCILQQPYIQLLSQQSQDLKEFITQQRQIDKSIQKKKENPTYQTDDLSFEYKIPKCLRKYSFQYCDNKQQYNLNKIQIQFKSNKQINLIYLYLFIFYMLQNFFIIYTFLFCIKHRINNGKQIKYLVQYISTFQNQIKSFFIQETISWEFQETADTKEDLLEVRAFEKGRQAAMTKLVSGEKRVRRLRVRGGNFKFRALRLSEGNFSWGSQGVAKKAKIVEVVYHPSNNELVRTKTLTRGVIVQIDAAPFRQWYAKKYNVELGSKKKDKKEGQPEQTKKSRSLIKKLEQRAKDNAIDALVQEQFTNQRLLVRITSRPGQSGRADGYILEGKELEFYIKKVEQKKK